MVAMWMKKVHREKPACANAKSHGLRQRTRLPHAHLSIGKRRTDAKTALSFRKKCGTRGFLVCPLPSRLPPAGTSSGNTRQSLWYAHATGRDAMRPLEELSSHYVHVYRGRLTRYSR